MGCMSGPAVFFWGIYNHMGDYRSVHTPIGIATDEVDNIEFG